MTFLLQSICVPFWLCSDVVSFPFNFGVHNKWDWSIDIYHHLTSSSWSAIHEIIYKAINTSYIR